MATFITVIEKDGEKYEGPNIEALSWEDAERQAQEQGVELVGESA